MQPIRNTWNSDMREQHRKINAHRQRCRALPALKMAEAESLIAAFILKRGGVTHCPAAYLVPMSCPRD
jgi:hypothetical protein